MDLSGVSTRVLVVELDRRDRQIDGLKAKRSQLLAEVADLDAQLRDFGVASPGRGRPAKKKRGSTRRTAKRAGAGRRRPRNTMKLADAIEKVLNGKTMSVKAIVPAVKKAGYKTTSQNFRTIVNQALLTNPRFKKVSRGQYTVK